MSRLLPVPSLVLLVLMVSACAGGGGPTAPEGDAPADASVAADLSPLPDAGGDLSAADDAAADVPADLPPPPSPWLRPWRCTALIVTDSEGSHGENPLDEFGLAVTGDPHDALSLQIDHYLFETCLMTWTVDGDDATLTPLECADNQFPPNEYTFTTGTAAVEDATLAVEISGTKLHGRSGTLYTMALTLDCVGCPDTPCGLACAWGVCCGGEGEACCDAKDKCAGDLECLDGGCVDPGDIPCPSNFCEDSGLSAGWHCGGDTQYRCTSLPNGCFGAVLSDTKDCDPGACDPATGTCNGCDPGHVCNGAPANAKLCDGGGHGLTCGEADGCPAVIETVTCTNACVAGSGCCGSAGEPCCAAMGDFCEGGLGCQGGVCQ